MPTVSTANVNGVRAASGKGLLDRLAGSDADVGRRIDHHLATPGLAARAKDAVVERAGSHAGRRSDHAPVTVRYAP